MHRAPPGLDDTLGPLGPLGPLGALAFAIASSALLGCTPSVGDRCTLSTDCSVQGNRVCDTSEPNGYCTLLGCTPNACPDNATCVEFGASVPGCPYDDYHAPSRLGRSMCMKTCTQSSDCRESDGYTCVSPTLDQNQWTAILDTDQTRKVCMIAGTMTTAVGAPVCSYDRPDAAPLDLSSSGDASGDDGAVVGEDGGGDGGGDEGPVEAGDGATGDGGTDTSGDASTDDGADATPDATVDAGAADAQDGS